VKIAIIGAGNVGGALGAAFSRVGHEVTYGVRDPGSGKAQAALGGAQGARAVGFKEAAEGADVLVFALRWDAVADTIEQIGSLAGRVVVDAMNRFSGDPLRSTTMDLAQLAPGVKVAKAFNTTGFENMSTANTRSSKAAMFVAGDDPDAKNVARQLAAEIGFAPYDAGGLGNTKILEDMVKVWFALTEGRSRHVAFAVSES
jgi:8-hydroxy-5-deazaflavin:NADPH oxidoreductase